MRREPLGAAALMSAGREPHGVVVVTGTGGMGIAIARRLGGGRHLVLADVNPTALQAIAEILRGEGHRVHEVVTDVSDPDSVAALADAAAELGPIAALVHTAGVSPTQATSGQIIAVDVIGTALILDAFGAKAGPGTVGVCIASMAGSMHSLAKDVETALATTPTGELAALPVLDPSSMEPGIAYALAKRANQLRVQAASTAWGAQGARVVSVSPGIISTPMGQQELAGPNGDGMRTLIGMSGVKRLGTADDIAAAVEFLVSPAASFITGTDLLVDGGAVGALRGAGVI